MMAETTPSRRRVWLRLDQEPKAFVPLLPDFLNELAARIGIDVQDINVLDVRSGCVILVLELSEEAAERVLETLPGTPVPEVAKDALTRRWRLQQTRGDEVQEFGTLGLRRQVEPAVCWLHMSDLHVTPENKKADRWMREFVRDLPELLSARAIEPDFVLVSGDIARSADSAEYANALRFLREVKNRLPRPNCPWLIVPGNHDVDWSNIDPPSETQLRIAISGANDRVELGDLLQDPALDQYATLRQSSFRKFLDQAAEVLGSSPPGDRNRSQLRLNVGNITVGVAGLNSSLFSTRKDPLAFGGTLPKRGTIPDLDLQALVLGEDQLEEAFTAIEDCDVKIAVLHHPPLSEWFALADHSAQRTYLGQFDFVHRGHEHLPSQTRRTLAGFRSDVFEVAAGALYTAERWYRGFCTVSIDAESGLAETRFFSYGVRANRWIEDNEIAPQARVQTPLARRLRDIIRDRVKSRVLSDTLTA